MTNENIEHSIKCCISNKIKKAKKVNERGTIY